MRFLRFLAISFKSRNRGKRRSPSARRRQARPMVRPFEDRIVPTVTYQPFYGAESMTYKGGPVLNNAPVYLLFWGSYWNTKAGAASESSLVSAITNEFNSTVFDHLSQYTDSSGTAAGPAYVEDSWIATETADPASGFSDSKLQGIVSAAISDQYSPILSPEGIENQDGGHAPIYFVITPPNIHSSRGSNVFGYHSNYSDSSVSSQSIVYGWGGTDLVSAYDTQDNATLIASHEIGEALTDPYIQTNEGWMAYAGSSYPVGNAANPDEIGDFEPEYEAPDDISYSYRLNGSLVQALWDENAGAFTVPDGNEQTFEILPQYQYDSATGNNDYIGNQLDIYGDQFYSGYDNVVLITTTAAGGFDVHLNGDDVIFDPGQITALYVYTGSGTDDVSVLATPAGVPTYINGGGTNDTVTIGNLTGLEGNGFGNMERIAGSINVYGSGTIHLNLDDSADASTQSVTMTDGEIDYGSAAPITYTPTSNSQGGVVGLGVYGGTGGNSFFVHNTSNFFDWTYLNTGSGGDSVFVDATTGTLYDNNPGGSDFTELFVGSLNGLVYAYGAGSTGLSVNDAVNSTARTVSMYDGSLYGMGAGGIVWSSSSGATGGVTSLSVYGGSGSDTFNIYSTSNFYYSTDLNTGKGNDTVYVYDTTGALTVDNAFGSDLVDVGLGNMTGIHGPLYLPGVGETALTLDDSLDTTARTVKMTDGSVTGLAPASITWALPSNGAGIDSLDLDGGSGGNTFNVANTSSFSFSTFLDTGTGNDTVNVSATTGGLYDYNPGGSDNTYVGLGSTANIAGFVDVYGAGSTRLDVNDSNDTTGRTVSMDDGTLSGLAPANITWTPTASATGGVTYLEVDGGTGADTFNVNQTSKLYLDTAVDTGAGNDQVYVSNTTGGLLIVNSGGLDSTDLGLGSVANLNGFVEVEGSGSGSTDLLVDDSSDSGDHTVTLNGYSLEGLGNTGNISYNAPLLGNGKVSLTVAGGSGNYTWNINGTSSTTTSINTGAGANYIYVNTTTGPLNLNNAGTAYVFAGSGNMSNINGTVDVSGAGSTSLYLNDANDTTARAVTVNDGSLTGLAPGAIDWTPSSSATGGVTYFEVDGTSAGSTYNIKNTSNFYYHIYFQTGAGNDTVNIDANQGELYEYNAGGTDSVNVGVGSVSQITGFVDVYGTGTATMVVDDHLDTTGRHVTLTNNTLTGLGNAGAIYYDSSVTALTIRGSSKASTYDVQSTSASTPVAITGGGAADTFNVGDAANTLDGIQGALTLNGGSGGNKLNIKDQGSSAGQNYTQSKTVFTRSGAAAITYSYVPHLSITASNGGNDLLTILSPVPTAATIFTGGTGANTLQGANVNTTWTINGNNAGKVNSVAFSNFQTLIGGTANDTFKFTTAAASVSSPITGGGGRANKLDYSKVPTQLISVTLTSLTTGWANRIGGGFSGINSVAGNSNTGNVLTGPNLVNLWTITGANRGTLKVGTVSFSFTNMPNLVGGTNVDTFKLASTKATIGSLNGGGAPLNRGDWLNYLSFSSNPVTVNLATGSATNVSGGAAGSLTGIQNVIGASRGTNKLTGNSQGNILIGGSGSNTIAGGSGDSLLIGGSGSGSITGGSGQDILIAGTLTYKDTTAAGQDSLMALWAELPSSDTFAQKVYDLIHGTDSGDPNGTGSNLNGHNKLTWGISGATVKASAGAFTLSGDTSAATSADWFFSNLSSTVTDFNDDGVSDQHNDNALGVF